MTLVVGLTGGIGSGKSTVSRLLSAQGAVVADADQIARELVEPGTPGLAAIVARFGREMLDSAGRLLRQELGRAVFADPTALSALNAILHPAIVAEIEARGTAAKLAGDPVFVIDAALLVEFGLHRRCDVVWVVTSDLERRVARVATRDGLDASRVRARIAAQATDEQRLKVADSVIDNRGDLAELERRVLDLWQPLGSPHVGS